MAVPPRILIPFQNATPLSRRRVDRQGSLVPQQSGGANLPVPESSTGVATGAPAGCGPARAQIRPVGSTKRGSFANQCVELAPERAESLRQADS